MKIIDVPRHGAAALGDGLAVATHTVARWTRSSTAAGPPATGGARAHVEVLRRLGGHLTRAFLGGRFTADDGTETRFEVGVSGFDTLDHGDAPTFRGALVSRPLIIGLPADLAPGALAGLAGGPPLPPGTLTVDQAAFDLMYSSAPAFAQAGAALRAALGAAVAGADPESAVCAVVAGW
ncbi:hypothetical protein [Amycolatopsis sp. NPDC051903]|uniref:hypothetical protein n=1 Tax=Amycolatopsis sp. NPDC051903 TaxID=3363936 RepID=UPI0037A4904F